MITLRELTHAGMFVKTHGISGELNATLSIEPGYLDFHPLFICEMDGIPVPFFIDGLRSKGSQSVLIHPKGFCDELEAKAFVGKDFFVIKKDYVEYSESMAKGSEDGAYASDLIGYTVHDRKHGLLGEIVNLEDSTANLLFIVHTTSGSALYIPVDAPFIKEIDQDGRNILTDLPEGLIELNE